MTVKKVVLYEAQDGTAYKTSKGAENHNKRLAVSNAKNRLELTEDEITEKLVQISPKYPIVRVLLNSGPWTSWAPHQIDLLTKDVIFDESKKTEYVYIDMRMRSGESKIAEEVGNDFTEDNLHAGDLYKVARTEVINEFTKKVFYTNKYGPDEVIRMKLKSGEDLTEDEISNIFDYFEEVYVDEGENRRWSQSILSVFDVDGVYYALPWERGLTESQENSYYDQPYEVILEKKEVVTIQTVITPVKK